jgi:hypothetical protein
VQKQSTNVAHCTIEHKPDESRLLLLKDRETSGRTHDQSLSLDIQRLANLTSSMSRPTSPEIQHEQPAKDPEVRKKRTRRPQDYVPKTHTEEQTHRRPGLRVAPKTKSRQD